MKTIKKSIKEITSYLENLNDDDLVSVHNQMCQNQNRVDDEIYINDEDFFNTFFDNKVLDAIRAVSYGEYNYTDEYVIFNGYANLESFNNPSGRVDISEIAEDIMENPEDYDIELEEDEEENEK